MHKLTGVALAAALMLSACATGGGTCDTLCMAKKTLTAAHLGHEAAADAAGAAARSGLLTGENAFKAKQYLTQSETYLKAADEAIAVGDAATAQTDANQANALTGKAAALAH